VARILIAEDDADVRRLVALALEGEGHEVVTAVDGMEALHSMAEQLPDLMLLDVMMPNLDGYGVLDHMASSGMKDHVRVMMVTAKGSERDAKRGLERGCDAYMTKPFDVIDLIEKVAEMCSMSMVDLRAEKMRELDKTRLLSQLESLLEGEAPPLSELGG
jgi:DNA-binding response OmpR family regulator